VPCSVKFTGHGIHPVMSVDRIIVVRSVALHAHAHNCIPYGNTVPLVYMRDYTLLRNFIGHQLYYTPAHKFT
jgi:hypothetical protein